MHRHPIETVSMGASLAGHPDRDFVQFLLRGIDQGFHLGFDGAVHQVKGAQKNMQSALDNPKPVEEYLGQQAELQRSRLPPLG